MKIKKFPNHEKYVPKITVLEHDEGSPRKFRRMVDALERKLPQTLKLKRIKSAHDKKSQRKLSMLQLIKEKNVKV